MVGDTALCTVLLYKDQETTNAITNAHEAGLGDDATFLDGPTSLYAVRDLVDNVMQERMLLGLIPMPVHILWMLLKALTCAQQLNEGDKVVQRNDSNVQEARKRLQEAPADNSAHAAVHAEMQMEHALSSAQQLVSDDPDTLEVSLCSQHHVTHEFIILIPVCRNCRLFMQEISTTKRRYFQTQLPASSAACLLNVLNSCLLFLESFLQRLRLDSPFRPRYILVSPQSMQTCS